MRVLNTTQMREADRRTIEEIGLPSLVLMENAGRQVVATMESAFEDLAGMREVRSEYLTSEPPASTAVQVVALVVPDALIEIDLVAVVPA